MRLDLTVLEMDNLEKVAKHAMLCHEIASKLIPKVVPGYLLPDHGVLELYTTRFVDNPYLPKIIYEFPRLIVSGLKHAGNVDDRIKISGHVDVELENDHVKFDVYLQVTGFSREKTMDALRPERVLELMIKNDTENKRFGYFWATQSIKMESSRSTSVKYPHGRWNCGDDCDNDHQCDGCVSYANRLKWYEQDLIFNLSGYVMHDYDLDEWTFFKDHPINMTTNDGDPVGGDGVDVISEMIRIEAPECNPEYVKPVIETFIKSLMDIVRGERCKITGEKGNVIQVG